VVIAGGTDSLINLLAMISFGKLGVIPVATKEPDCKPFDINRNGTLAGESAGFAILASEDFLEKNKLNAMAQLLGYGNTMDGYKITAPDPSGDSMTQAIKYAMQNSGISANMLSYINAHGTGTKHNDALELSCIERALGSFGNKVPISSTKDRHGHAIAAAGIQEFCVLMELMKNSVIPGNLNLKVPCNSDFNLIGENKTEKIEYALSSNFAFGGINTVLAVKNEMP
jgi:3-oxoacyl-[acyl-carrier-protein] synthase II